MRVSAFCEKYELEIPHLYASASQGQFPKYVLSGTYSAKYIDEKYFLSRADFKTKVWHTNHDNYYKLFEIYKSASAISRLLHTIFPWVSVASWDTFQSDNMWRLQSYSILSVRIPELSYLYFRGSTWLLRINKRYRNRLVEEAGYDKKILDVFNEPK